MDQETFQPSRKVSFWTLIDGDRASFYDAVLLDAQVANGAPSYLQLLLPGRVLLFGLCRHDDSVLLSRTRIGVLRSTMERMSLRIISPKADRNQRNCREYLLGAPAPPQSTKRYRSRKPNVRSNR